MTWYLDVDTFECLAGALDVARLVAELACLTLWAMGTCHCESFAFLMSVDHGTGAETERAVDDDLCLPGDVYTVLGRTTSSHAECECEDRYLYRCRAVHV